MLPLYIVNTVIGWTSIVFVDVTLYIYIVNTVIGSTSIIDVGVTIIHYQYSNRIEFNYRCRY